MNIEEIGLTLSLVTTVSSIIIVYKVLVKGKVFQLRQETISEFRSPKETTILLAENDPESREVISRLFEKQGFRVISAANPTETQKLIAGEKFDLAVLDLRLKDDTDEKDMSGLNIAKEGGYSVPTIILTSHSTYNAINKTQSIFGRDLPKTVDFVSKENSLKTLLAAVERSILVHVNKSPKSIKLNLSEQLEIDYIEARKQSFFNHRARLSLLVIGTIVIIFGSILAISGRKLTGLLVVIFGIVTEALAALLAKQSEVANARVDQYHKELLALYSLDIT